MFPHENFSPLVDGHNSLADSEVIIVSVGGNDVREFLQRANFYTGSAKTEYLSRQFPIVMETLKENYILIINKIREINKIAKIILMTQYYPSVTQKNYKIYEEMAAVGKALNLGDASHPMNVIHDIMKLTYQDIAKYIVTNNLQNMVVADITSSLNPYDNNNHVSQIEPSAEGGKKIAAMLKFLIKRDTTSLDNTIYSYRFYPEFFLPENSDTNSIYADKNNLSNLRLAHPHDLRDQYTFEEEKAYTDFGGDSKNLNTLVNELEAVLQNHAVSSDLYNAGLAVLTESKKIITDTPPQEDQVKRLKLSLILSIGLLQNSNYPGYSKLLQNHVKKRPLGNTVNSAELTAALLILAGVALLAITFALNPPVTTTLIAGAITGGALIALGVGLFAYKKPRPEPITKTFIALVAQFKR